MATEHQNELSDSQSNETVEPPTTLLGIVARLGPGLIIAGSIVGSGELIATTKTGAQAGIALLWLIIIGCLIKVFAQIELGRYAISSGETTLSALNKVPGPRLGVNWIMMLWTVMILCTIGQLGGIVGGVGQAAAMTFPFTGDYQQAIIIPSDKELQRFIETEDDITSGGKKLAQLSEDRQKRIRRGHEKLRERIAALGERGERIVSQLRESNRLGEEYKARTANLAKLTITQPKAEFRDPNTYDDKIWAAIVAVFTAVLLYRGRYGMIQTISLVLVVTFTFITIGNVIALHSKEQFALTASDYLKGLSFGAPEAFGDVSPWVTALATFGIIGVGASELIAYPYWCLEKGYGRFTGKRSNDDAWANRARGWMKVMRYDAFASMVIYTIATLAFFVMGVAVLYNDGLDPDGMRMVGTLAEAYVPVFGEYAKWLFLVGAIAVLYSTFLVANAGNARMVADAFRIYGFMKPSDAQGQVRTVSVLSVVLPLMCLAVFCTGINPVTVILIAGMMQAVMLPVVGLGALYFRFTKIDERLRPSKLWDVMLIISFVGLFIAGAYGFFKQIQKFME